MVIDTRITHVLIDVTNAPPIGDAKLLVRLQENDRDLVSQAAVIVGMSQQNFMRAVLINASEKVLKEARNLPV